MAASYHRHDISDHAWSLLEPHLPGRAGGWGGVARNNRLFINAGFCVPARPGGICHPVTVTGKTPTVAFVVGGTKGSGKSYWNN